MDTNPLHLFGGNGKGVAVHGILAKLDYRGVILLQLKFTISQGGCLQDQFGLFIQFYLCIVNVLVASVVHVGYFNRVPVSRIIDILYEKQRVPEVDS